MHRNIKIIKNLTKKVFYDVSNTRLIYQLYDKSYLQCMIKCMIKCILFHSKKEKI